jgi:hypothetical protein
MAQKLRTIRGSIELAPSTQESLAVTIECDRDPTDDPPEFQLATKGAGDPTGTWVAGAWLGTWDAETHVATAVTPILGSAIPLTTKTDRDLWVKVTVGGESPRWPVGTISVT